jgi:hypothetical protein
VFLSLCRGVYLYELLSWSGDARSGNHLFSIPRGLKHRFLILDGDAWTLPFRHGGLVQVSIDNEKSEYAEISPEAME